MNMEYNFTDVYDEDNFTNTTDLCPMQKGISEWELCVYTLFAPQAVNIDRIVSPFWYCIGFIGNIITVHVWSNRRLKRLNTSSLYLSALAITDTMMLTLHILMELEYAWGKPTLRYPVWCTIFFVLFYFSQYMSPLLVFGFTCERFVSIIKPFKSERFSRHSRAPKEVACLTIFAFLVSLGQITGWHVTNGRIKPLHEKFYIKWSYVTEILIFIVIPIITLIFNILVMLTARQATKLRRESTSPHTYSTCEGQNLHRKPATKILPTTLTLMAVSFYRIFTTAPISIIYMFQYEVFPYGEVSSTSAIAVDPVWKNYFHWLVFKKILDEVGLSQYSCNIFIYIVTARHFRMELFRLLCSNTLCGDKDTMRKEFMLSHQSNGASSTRPTNGSML